MKHLYALAAALAITISTYAQCLTNVDFNTWHEAGYPANGNWVVQGGGNQVRQTVNGNPTYFISPFDLMNVTITGNFRTTDGDDDMMGFVFSFKNPFGASDTTVTWLFDWKQKNQNSGGYMAYAGMSVNNINGVIPANQYSPTFWAHQNTLGFNCVANNFPSAGWVTNQIHSFQLDLSYTRATIYIDGVQKFDIVDCFSPGRFGFYNYSQQDCYYSNFQYTMNVSFTVDHQQTCMGDSAIFNFMQPCTGANTALAQYQSLRWNYGDGTTEVNNNPTLQNVNSGHVYNTPGNYNVELIVTDVNGCSDTATEMVTILPKPVAAFSATNQCFGKTIQFTDQTTGTPNQWKWDFGSGNTSTVQNPSFNLGAVGQHPVTLYIADAVGCKDTLTQMVDVYAKPLAKFEVDTVCQGQQTTFTNTSSSDVTTWDWNFGDASSHTTTPNTSHIYANSGSFNAVLIVNTVNGCADTLGKTVVVKPNPVADFSAAAVCYQAATQFVNNSTGALDNIWLFGDNNITLQVNPSHTYSAPGIYTVTLLINSTLACGDTITKQVTVKPKPTAAFTATTVCQGNTTTFTSTSSISGGTITNHYWAFGDGNTDFNTNPTHIYGTANTYNAILAVQSDIGCYDTLSQIVTVNANPVAAINAGAVCLNQANTFTDASTITSGNLSQWAWDFGDGYTANSQNPSHVYAAQGNYTVKLLVASSQGCIDSTTQNITVFDRPTAAFTASEECQGVASQFTDGSNIGTGTISQWLYSFGDGSSNNGQNTSHLYQNSGVFNSSLIVTSSDGCTDTASQTVRVNPRTQMAFSYTNVCEGATAVFNNQSNIINGSVSTWGWNLGDGTAVNTQNGSHQYAQAGSYTVWLKAVSDKGCEDSLSQILTVFDLPVASVNTTPACFSEANGSAKVDVNGGNPGYFYAWNNGGSSAQNQDLIAGNYTVTVTDGNQCTATASAIVDEPTGSLTLSNPINELKIELNESVQIGLKNSYNATVQYQIKPSYGLSCTDCESISAQPYKTTEYQVELTDSLGCKGYGSFKIIVDQSIPLFIPNAFSPNGDGHNDIWSVYTQALYSLRVQVFNRIGEVVFESEDDKIAWDGRYKGEVLPAGVYTYVLSLQWLNGAADVNKTGSVQLMR